MAVYRPRKLARHVGAAAIRHHRTDRRGHVLESLLREKAILMAQIRRIDLEIDRLGPLSIDSLGDAAADISGDVNVE
jgi:hypothetical protein